MMDLCVSFELLALILGIRYANMDGKDVQEMTHLQIAQSAMGKTI